MTINRNKEIKTDTIALVNRANELHKRNQKARSYSKNVKRKAELKSKVRCGIICAALLTIGEVPFVMGVQNVVANDIITEEPTEIITTTSRTETAVLVDIDSETGDYILQTEDGNLWGIQDGEEIYFQLEFSSNGNLEDDTIIGVEIMK